MSRRWLACALLGWALIACAPAATPARPTPEVAGAERTTRGTAVAIVAAPASEVSSAGDGAFLAQATGQPAGSGPPQSAPAATFGPLTAVPLEVAPRQRVEPFDQARTLSLPTGWRARVFAAGLDRPRLLAFDERGVLHVSQLTGGSVVALPDRDGDGAADETVLVRGGLELPHGLVFRDGWLYVAETNRVVRLGGEPGSLVRPVLEPIVDSLPAGAGHFTRTLAIGDDGALYVSIGSSCNVCEEADPRRAAIVRYAPDGGGEHIFARGLRNAVGLAWRPGTRELWATNNGRDWLGDDEPPETLNLVRDGDDFGWPRCINGQRPDPDFGRAGACDGVARPRVELGAHEAPLGLAFYPEANTVLVALHGSWNRTVAAAPRVVRVQLGEGGPATIADFATGWQPGASEGSRWGRPVDVAIGPDGHLYVSDDRANAIYQLTPPR